MAIKAVVTDIEGTTTSISFVHDVLFPVARNRMYDYLKLHVSEHEKEIAILKSRVAEEEERDYENISLADVVALLRSYIDEDRKDTSLKNIQGKIWKEEYQKGRVTGHLYDDVLPVLKSWKDSGLLLAVYSSGSVEAQKLLYSHSDAGDISSLFSAWFDTKVGGKRETPSYQKIATELALPAGEILFLSDIEAELDAAKEAGFQTIQLVREGTTPSDHHQKVASFSEIDLKNF